MAPTPMGKRNQQILSPFLREPYRIFFPLGMILGSFGVAHWLFYAVGWQSGYSPYFHSFLQMHVFIGCFVAGFLLTAIPRFSGAHHATGPEVASVLGLLLLTFSFLTAGLWTLESFSYIAFLLALGRFIGVRFHKARLENEPTEFVWIPLGIFHGIVGTLIYVAARQRLIPTWLLEVGEDMSELGFIFCAVIGVGGFLIPRLIGRQRLFIRPLESHSLEEIRRTRRNRMMTHFIAGLFLFLSFWLEATEARTFGFVIRALVITAEFIWAGSIPFPPRTEGNFAKLLWISAWMIVVGSWMLVLFPDHEKTMLHLIFIGGFSLMIFSIATVVILSHAGQAGRLKQRLWVLRAVLIGVVGAICFRILAVFSPENYFLMLAHSSAFWLSAALCWLWFVLPRMFIFPVAEPRDEPFSSCEK